MKGLSIGVVGLGKMGGNIALNLIGKGYDVHVLTTKKEKAKRFGRLGASATVSINAFAKGLKRPRIVWLMLPAGDPTRLLVARLAGLLNKGDMVIDGSNSRYTESVAACAMLGRRGIKYLDAGCSGGPSGALNGMCIMVGGSAVAFNRLEGLFRDLSVDNGYLFVGPAGSGHFVKMVHNAIEYGMMQSIAEGFELVRSGPYRNTDLARIAKLWNNGSVIRSYLIELAQRALEKDRNLAKTAPYVEDTGEGRWSVEEAIRNDVPFTVISHSLFERMRSRSDYRFSDRMLAALRREFGGHRTRATRK